MVIPTTWNAVGRPKLRAEFTSGFNSIAFVLFADTEDAHEECTELAAEGNCAKDSAQYAYMMNQCCASCERALHRLSVVA